MKIEKRWILYEIINVDNNTLIDRYFFGEPALSFFIEVDNKRIVFDTMILFKKCR
jgi:metal-dependent hydrolase (beta-lactamase superfamily II)